MNGIHSKLLQQKPANMSVTTSRQYGHYSTFEPKDSVKVSENPSCYFDIVVDHTDPFRIVVELFADKVPKTCENFLGLVKGDREDAMGRKIHYKDSVFYELIPGWVVAGGDFINNNGTAGESAINGTVFKDENFSISHDRPGIISMLGHGPNTNSSLFFITLKPAEWLDGLYVAFGEVVFGLDMLANVAEKYGSQSGFPEKPVRIVDCGELYCDKFTP